MDYELLLDKLINKTENNSQEWNIANNIPSCIVLPYKDLTKVLYTNLTSDMQFYLIEFSYETYNPDTYEYDIEYSRRCSILKNNLEALYFTKQDIVFKSKIDELFQLALDSTLNIKKDLQDYLDHD